MNKIRVHKQSGVIALATPFIILLIFTLTVLLLDGARLYAAKREMQAIANAAAAAAADKSQTCDSLAGLPVPAMTAQMENRASQAAILSGWDENGTLTVMTGVVESVDSGDDDGVFLHQFEERPMLQSNAVGVRYQRSHNISLLLGGLGSIDLETSAVAKKDLYAALVVESYTASLDSTESALLNLIISDILQQDGGLALSGVSFDSIQGVLVDAEDLVAGLAGGTAAGDILASEVTAEAVLDVLRTTSDATGPAATAIDQLADAAVGSNTNVALEDIIQVAGGGSIPPGAKIPALAVINSTIFNVGKSLPGVITVDLADSGLLGSLLSSIAGLDTATVDIQIDEAPGVIFAPPRQDQDGEWLGQARSADITVTIRLGLDLDLGVARLTGNLPLQLQTGSSQVELVGARCAAGADTDTGNDVYFVTDVTNSLLALSGSGSLTVSTLLLGTVANPQITADSGSYGGGTQSEQLGPFTLHEGEPMEREFGDSSDALTNAVAGLTGGLEVEPNLLPGLPILSLALNTLLADLTSTLSALLVPLIDAVGQLILEPLVEALGLSLGSTKLTVSAATQGSVVILEDVAF